MTRIVILTVLLILCLGAKVNADSSGMAAASMVMSAAAIASANSARSSAAAQAAMQEVKADGMVICKEPKGDSCLVARAGCLNGYDNIKYPEFVKRSVGYDVEIVSMSYNGHSGKMYLYFVRK